MISRTDQTQEDRNARTEIQIAVTIGLVTRSEQLQPRDHSACTRRPRKWAMGYIRDGTLVRWI